MLNILFVDDEPNILEGLQRMLRSMRHDWKMSFVGSGNEALVYLKEHPMDVIVSDMKMPGLDGAGLLTEVRNQYPQTIRIILSGYSEKDMIMKSLGTTHQYLSKPCDAEILKATVTRVCNLRNLLTDERLRRLVSQMPTIPSLPTLYSDLLVELNKPEPSTRKVGEIVKKDMGMTVKILQIVNSAFFGLQRRISDTNEAVEFLGLDTISSLTLGLGVISQFESSTPSQLILNKLWKHSLAVGVLAQKLAKSENPLVAVDAFTAGLLHDIGEVVLAVNLPEQFDEVQQLVKHENLSRLEAEQQVFETTHAEVGAYLLGLWGLPTQVVEAVAFHHTPNDYHTDIFTALTAVHAADAIDHLGNSDNSKMQSPFYDEEYLKKLGLLEKFPVWQSDFAAALENKN